MHNANIPPHIELPTSGQLLRSTLVAATTAAVLLVTTVLPAEYGVDPTGIGRVLGLTQMGEVKASLAEEAAIEDRAAKQGAAAAAPVAPNARGVEQRSDATDSFSSRLMRLVVAPAAAATVVPTPAAAAPRATAVADVAKSDEMSLTLRPNEGVEVKLEMRAGAKANFTWKAEGGVVNFDTHGEPYNAPRDFSHSYKKGRQAAGDEGVIQAAFDGHHGWFWRNRSNENVTIKLRTSGDYLNLKRVK